MSPYKLLLLSLLTGTLGCSPNISWLWPGCRIPYVFHDPSDVTTSSIFEAAIAIWERETCIDFDPAPRINDSSWLVLRKGPECSAGVGRRVQALVGSRRAMIADDCYEVGDALHVLGHAIGLWDEHNRPDRDDYITVHYQYIQQSKWDHFVKTPLYKFSQVPDVGYDIQSIMHFGSQAFTDSSGNAGITINADANLTELYCTNALRMGQRSRLSYKDKQRVNLLYNCPFTLEEPACNYTNNTLSSLSHPPTQSSGSVMNTTLPLTSGVLTLTPPPLDDILRSGNVVKLTFGGYGVKCLPSTGCTPIECQLLGGNSCEDNANQFKIIRNDTPSSTRIYSGDTVLFRSVRSPSLWVDCADTLRCGLSFCNEDNVEDRSDSGYMSSCGKHRFRVKGENRIKIKKGTGRFLNCNGKRCQLLQQGHCPAAQFRLVPVTPVDGQCPVQRFTITKLSEN